MADPRAGQQKEEATVSDGLLQNLENDFQEAMNALEGEESLGQFRLEYEKLYGALKRSHETEKQLVVRCQELTQELLGNAAKMQAAVKLSQGDNSTIEALKKEIEKAWRTVDSANDKDLRARETVKSLKQEVVSLQALIQQGSSISVDHTSTLEELKLENKRLQAECEDSSKQVEVLSREINEMTIEAKQLEKEAVSNAEEVHRVDDRFELVRQEHRRERNARERADIQMKELLVVLQGREKEKEHRDAQMVVLTKAIETLRAQMGTQGEKVQTLRQKLETAEKQLFHTQQSYNDSVDTTADINERLQAVSKDILKAEKKIMEQRNEIERIRRVTENDFKELGRLKQQQDNVRQEQEAVTHQTKMVQRRIATVRKEKERMQEARALLQRERGLLQQRGEAEKAKQAALEELLRTVGQDQAELEDAITRETEIAARLKGHLHRLEKDRERCVAEISQVNVQHTGASEELKLAEAAVAECQKQIDDSDAKLVVQKNKYEQLRAERNQFSKKLVEAQDEMVELKQRFKMLDHQIAQFKDESQMKQKKQREELSREHALKERLTKSRKLVNDQTAEFKEAVARCESMQQEVKQLVKVVDSCDKELSAQQQEFLKVSSQRDLLGTQLIRRNDELALLYEKLRLQQETMRTGEAAYRARLEDMRLLRLKAADIKRKAVIADNRSRDIDELKRKVRLVEQDLENEKATATALADELENPQSSNRWRTIGGSDPSVDDLNEKLADLQKRLITKSEESLEHELTIQEKERLVAELQTILSRQPGPDVARKLNTYSKELQKKNVQMKGKASQLNMTSTHISELKYEAERLRRELHEVKRKYYEVKMQNDALLAPPTLRQETPPPHA